MSKLIIINTVRDSLGSVANYRVDYYFNADGSATTVTYKAGEDLTKIIPLLSKDDSGLAKDSDRALIWLNDDDTLNLIDHQVNSTKKDEATIRAVKTADEAPQIVAKFEAFKAELDVKAEVPPKPEPPPEEPAAEGTITP